MGTSSVVVLQKESYLATIRNAVGTNMYRNLYALVNGEKQDIVKDGVRSCSLFVSSILNQFHLIESAVAPHATIAGLERNMKKSGWQVTDTPKPGDVILWEPIKQVDDVNPHVGFFIGDDQAVSNDWQTSVPIKHHITYGTKSGGKPIRAITAIYTHELTK